MKVVAISPLNKLPFTTKKELPDSSAAPSLWAMDTMTQKTLTSAETWIFDLDNTLYPAKTDLFSQVDVRIRDYIANFLDMEKDAAYKLQKDYFREYGTTMRGLMTNHGLDPRPFLAYVHDIDVSPVMPSPHLDEALEKLPGRKIIYTNASTAHADRVMKRLGVAEHFSGVFDIIDAGYNPKPEPEPYRELVKRFGIDPKTTVMVEDIASNLKPAAAMGMSTVWVQTGSRRGDEDTSPDYIHHAIDDLADWLGALVG